MEVMEMEEKRGMDEKKKIKGMWWINSRMCENVALEEVHYII